MTTSDYRVDRHSSSPDCLTQTPKHSKAAPATFLFLHTEHDKGKQFCVCTQTHADTLGEVDTRDTLRTPRERRRAPYHATRRVSSLAFARRTTPTFSMFRRSLLRSTAKRAMLLRQASACRDSDTCAPGHSSPDAASPRPGHDDGRDARSAWTATARADPALPSTEKPFAVGRPRLLTAVHATRHMEAAAGPLPALGTHALAGGRPLSAERGFPLSHLPSFAPQIACPSFLAAAHRLPLLCMRTTRRIFAFSPLPPPAMFVASLKRHSL